VPGHPYIRFSCWIKADSFLLTDIETSIMSTTIAIIGHNGNVGKKVLPHLIKAHQAGQIKLVVLHRPSSAIDSVPSYVEKRVIAGTDPDSLKEVVKGVHVLL
jgi:hypothetical protein